MVSEGSASMDLSSSLALGWELHVLGSDWPGRRCSRVVLALLLYVVKAA